MEAARRRLALWELSEEQIAEMERTGQPVKSITVYAPASGYITERNAFPNQKIEPEMELYTIVDLSRVWVMADVFEADASSVREGMAARVVVQGRSLAARVNYIQPAVDAATRTLKVRLEMANPGMRLKPDMFVDVEFAAGGAAVLSVPAEAVLDSGSAQAVFVDRGNGSLEPRSVETGDRFEDRVEIPKGFKTGERIVACGEFLIDSESQMRAVTRQ